ncbi:putative transcription factor C2H2 family [Helianthus annuus]|nr:putative transcription factor C2H2 family [Helianthus annuus]
MESSSSSSRYRQLTHSYSNHKRFLLNHLIPAIDNQSCSICLSKIEEAAVITACLHAYCTHCIRRWSNQKRKCPLCNAQFASLFVDIDRSCLSFRTQRLLPPVKESVTKVNDNVRDVYSRRREFLARRRAIGISRELNAVSRRTRPLPKQRSFGQSNMLPRGVSKERILQWRASIYKQNMLAVPCPTRKSLEQGFMGRNGNREMLLKRIEPWIHRELHAVLGDPNPAILVHLVTSLFISSLEETRENNHLERLQPFLLERTSTFWHELRCFAESSLNMETYDTVVKYAKA